MYAYVCSCLFVVVKNMKHVVDMVVELFNNAQPGRYRYMEIKGGIWRYHKIWSMHVSAIPVMRDPK